jgi:hypothetical protein
MAANYTGNPAAVQAPAAAPSPGAALIVSLPADTDGATWANLYQAFKASTDYITWLMKSGSGAAFGAAFDGNVTLDGAASYASFSSRVGSVYTLTRDLFADNLTVNAGCELKTAGFRVYVRNALTTVAGAPNGLVTSRGVAGSTSTAGGSTAIGTLLGSGGGFNGANITPASPGTSTGNTWAGGGGAGGNGTGGNNGTAGGAATNPAAGAGMPYAYSASTLGHIIGTNGSVFTGFGIQGGGGGGGGAGDAAASIGGGGGGGGGVLAIAARTLSLASPNDLYVVGGAGGNGGGTNSGGGGGGGGGVILLAYGNKNGATFTAAGSCPGGAGGARVGTGIVGVTGTNGSVIEIPAF